MNHLHRSRARRAIAALATGLLALGLASVTLAAPSPAQAAAAPVGEGFTVTPSDLAFILKQIKIAEQHAATATPANPCGTLVGPGPNQIPDRLSPTACGRSTARATTWSDAEKLLPRTSPSPA